MSLKLSILLLLITFGAFAVPPLFKRMGIPVVVGELLYGVALGATGLNVIQMLGFEQMPLLVEELAHIGLLFLLFLAGLELDFVELQKLGVWPVVLGTLIMVGTVLLSAWGVGLLGLGFFVALVLSTSSADVIVRVLRSAGASETSYGQLMMVAALIADFLALLGIVFYEIYHAHGVDPRLLLFLGLFAGAVVALYLIQVLLWWYPDFFQRLMTGEDPDEVGVRSAVFLMFGFVVLAAVVGVEGLLGSFLAGAIIGGIFHKREILEDKLASFGFGFLIPIFYIWVGMSVDLKTLMTWESIKLVLLLVVIAGVVKVVPSLILVLTGHSLRNTFAGGFLLASRLSLIIAAAEIGRTEGLIDEKLYAALVLLAMVATTVFPMLFNWLYQPPDGEEAGEVEAAEPA